MRTSNIVSIVSRAASYLVLVRLLTGCSSDPSGAAATAGSGGNEAVSNPGRGGSSSLGGDQNLGGSVAGNGGASVADSGSSSAGSAGSSAGSGGVGNPSGGGTSANGGAGSGLTGKGPKQRTVVYLPGRRGPLKDWATKLDFGLISYVDVCFAGIDGAGNLSYGDAYLPQFAAAAHAKGGKVCLSLGGGGTGGGLGGGLAALIAPVKRADFVAKITSYTKTTGIDCIDVDFEGAGVNQDYEGFVTALSDSLHAEHKELTAALASWFGKQVTTKAINAFDFINVMAYDLHNPAGTTVPVQGSSVADSKAEIDYWIGRGLSKEKAVLGVPFYGYGWTNGSKGTAVTYSEILSTYGADAAQKDEVQKGGVTVFYSGKPSTQAKAQLARQYGGVMVWELGQDASGNDSLLRALNEAP